jgi:hypothetical protein
MIRHPLTKEQTMSNANAEPKPSYYELTAEELEKATGGITNPKVFDMASPGLLRESTPVEPI